MSMQWTGNAPPSDDPRTRAPPTRRTAALWLVGAILGLTSFLALIWTGASLTFVLVILACALAWTIFRVATGTHTFLRRRGP